MKLFPYQQDGVDFLLARNRAYLADEMGLGKTVQAVVAAHSTPGASVMVVAPASTIPNWRHEMAKWGSEEWANLQRVVSWGSLAKEAEAEIVILDEAHYAKNPDTKRTARALSLATQADRAWLLSGTPMPNDPRELYPPIAALFPEVLVKLGVKDYEAWGRMFCNFENRYARGRKFRTVTGAKNLDRLKPLLKGQWLRRLTRDVLRDLPEMRVDLHRLALPAAWSRIVGGLAHDWAGWEEPAEDSRRQLGMAKAKFIARVLAEELREGYYERIVVMYHHHDVARVLRESLESTATIDGGVPVSRRQALIDEFNAGDFPVLLVQQQAGGVGINLQSSAEIVLAEPDFSPDVNRQAIKRIHRIGQTRPCRARIFTAPDTYDERVMELIRRKVLMQQEAGL